MKQSEISIARLFNQKIAGAHLTTAKDIVKWMGAMQAQDYGMSKWAIGCRMSGSTEKLINTALENGEVFRTHLLRPTWHLVSAEDIYWMLEATAPQVKAIMKSSNKQLELTEAVFKKTNAIIEKALTGGKHLTRDELIILFEKTKIATHANRAAHLMMWAELEGLVASGIARNKETTYGLLAEKIKRPKSLTREEALTRLAVRYFTSHAPATTQDFTWWSGLSISDTKLVIENIKKDFVSEKIGAQNYWIPNSFSFPKVNKSEVYLLPAFDEYIISYKDRTAALPSAYQKIVISDNGLFRPVIVMNGEVKGIWKRTVKKDQVVLETQFFQPPGKTAQKLIENAAVPLGKFLDKKVTVVIE
jgi:hypothetical protein